MGAITVFALRCDRCPLLQRSLAAERHRIMFHDSLHCVKAGGADPDCLRSVFDYRTLSISLSGYRAKIRYPDFWISINNPTPELKLHGFSLSRKYLLQCVSLTVAAVAATMFTNSPLLH